MAKSAHRASEANRVNSKERSDRKAQRIWVDRVCRCGAEWGFWQYLESPRPQLGVCATCAAKTFARELHEGSG